MEPERFLAALERLMAARRPAERVPALSAALAALGEGELRLAVRRAMEALYPGGYGRLRVRYGDPAKAPLDRVI